MRMKRCPKCRKRVPSYSMRVLPGVLNAETKLKRYLCADCQRNIVVRRATDRRYEMSQYRGRDIVLRNLGYASYADYLKSERWRKIRLRVLKLRNFTCECCGGRATLVHHNLYRKQELLGQSLRGMKALCGDCHERAEFDGDRKVGLVEASHRLNEIKRSFLVPPLEVAGA